MTTRTETARYVEDILGRYQLTRNTAVSTDNRGVASPYFDVQTATEKSVFLFPGGGGMKIYITIEKLERLADKFSPFEAENFAYALTKANVEEREEVHIDDLHY